MALAMAYGGARGDTALAMRKTAAFEGEQDAVVRGWGRLEASVVDPARPLKLHIANRLFGEKTYSFEPAFVALSSEVFGAALEPVSFKTEAPAVTKHINEWVEQKTERRITNLLPALAKETRLVLVNAIYFLADWATPFSKDATRDEPFSVTASKQKTVPMMHRTGPARMGRTAEATILELPYKGDTAAMWIVLPNRIDGLADIERSLSADKLESFAKALAPEQVAISLPRFELNPAESMRLGDILKKMGMGAAFDREKADFTGIANPADKRDRLSIDEVVHKAFVKVDEKGTEAAAATAILMKGGGGAPPKPTEFRADHPFMFLIVDRTSQLLLFMGRFNEP